MFAELKKGVVAIAFACSLVVAVDAAENGRATEWIAFPDQRLQVSGLPWLKDNSPELWRLPKEAKARVPKAVWNRSLAPDGGRIRFSSTSSRVAIRGSTTAAGKSCFFDGYVNGKYAGSAAPKGTNETELILFEHPDHALKEITIYLPNNQEARLFAVGVDAGAEVKAPAPFARERPVVCYGSSVVQGSGAAHPAKTYPAALARRLNVDFVNLGFGGAGKAEPEVVDLVKQLDACCYIFDLGKSYGAQPQEPYARMLDAIRAAHPGVPILCVTPIYSTREDTEPGFRETSEKLRALMRQAAVDRRNAGDHTMFVVEGLELFGAADKDLFHDPLHPNDEGNERLAQRLAPIVEKALAGRTPPVTSAK